MFGTIVNIPESWSTFTSSFLLMFKIADDSSSNWFPDILVEDPDKILGSQLWLLSLSLSLFSAVYLWLFAFR